MIITIRTMLPSNLHPTRRKAVLLLRADVTVFFNVASDNEEEERLDWNMSRISARALTCREVPLLEEGEDDEYKKQFIVCFHHEGVLVKSFHVNVPLTWTAQMFLIFIADQAYADDGTISCVSSLDPNDLLRTNDISCLVEANKTYHPDNLMNLAMMSQFKNDVSGGDYCGC